MKTYFTSFEELVQITKQIYITLHRGNRRHLLKSTVGWKENGKIHVLLLDDRTLYTNMYYELSKYHDGPGMISSDTNFIKMVDFEDVK